MAIMPTKDSDIDVDSKKYKEELTDDGDEDYEVGEDEYFTTLRKSSAFTIERYSSKPFIISLSFF